MGIIVNNIKPIRIMFNGVEATLYHNGIKIWPESTDPYNPLNLPPNTVRVRTNDGAIPNKDAASYETATLVSGTSDVYDVYKSGTSFYSLLSISTNVVEVLGANTTGITNMGDMFYDCISLTTVPLFNTSSVTNMDGMFFNCNSLTSVPLFDTSSVTDMSSMLMNCISLTSVPLFNTSSVTDMKAMFQKCNSLTSVPLFDTSSVTDMYDMFVECSSLTTVPLFNTSSVTDMGYMFMNCTSLTSVPLLDTSSVTNMFSMFSNCSSLTSVPLFDTSSVTGMDLMFKNCTNVQSGALALYRQASTQTTPPSKHSKTFNNCGSNTTTGAAELAQIPEDWK